MSYTGLVSALNDVDTFHKNLLLMFDDLVSLVREKAYAGALRDITAPENGYFVWNANNSEHRRLWIFNHDGRIRFAVMLVKTGEDHLRGNSDTFKAMCVQLARDPKFPLMLIYGTFEPRDTGRFMRELNVRRHWVLNATLIDIKNEQIQFDISDLQFDKIFKLESKEGTDSYWCEKGDFVICDLTTISDTNSLSRIADLLLAFGVSDPQQQISGAQGAIIDYES